MKKILVIMILLFSFPMIISADECSNENKTRLQKLANNISTLVVEQDDGFFSIVFSGLSKELKIYSQSDYLNHYNTMPTTIGETTVEDLVAGNTYQFRVSGYATCYSTAIRTITINIPKKNIYYSTSVCLDVPDFPLCQKWASVSIKYDELTKKVNEYIENSKKNTTNTVDNTGKNNFFEFYEKYYWPIFIAMICALGVLIVLWLKENKKNKL